MVWVLVYKMGVDILLTSVSKKLALGGSVQGGERVVIVLSGPAVDA